MGYRLFINLGGYKEITSLVITDSIIFDLSLYNDSLHSQSSKVVFELEGSSQYVDDLLNVSGDVQAYVTDEGSNRLFTGYIAPTLEASVQYRRFGALKLTIEDNGKLLKRNWKSIDEVRTAYYNKTVTYVISDICALAGIVYETTNPNITSLVSFSILDVDNKKYWDVLDKICYEYGYSFYFSGSGKLCLYSLAKINPLPNVVFTSDVNIVGTLKIKKELQDFNEARITWNEWLARTNEVIVNDTTGKTAQYECVIPIQALKYYPSGADYDNKSTVEYDVSDGKKVVFVDGTTTDIVTDGGCTVSFANLGIKGQLSIYNTNPTLVKNIYRLKVTGANVLVEKSGQIFLSNIQNGDRYFEYTTDYIHTVADAQRLGNLLAWYYTFADYTYTLNSYEDYPLGSITTILDSDLGINVAAVITDKKSQPGKAIIYKLVGIGNFNLATPGNTNGNYLSTTPLQDTQAIVALGLNGDGTVAQPINSNGMIVDITPNGDGLYLTKTYIGLRSGGAWRSYIKSDGTFSFSGNANNSIGWNGTTLSLVGNITATSGTIGGISITSTDLRSTNYSAGISGFIIKSDGTVEINTLTARGSIYATAGTVGGTSMSSSKLYQGTGTYGNSNTPFYLDNSGKFSLKDKLTFDGTTLTLNGVINASSGTIGGNTLSATEFKSSNYVSGSTGFLINNSGFAEFNNINVRGNVNSSSGSIGGWIIASDKLSSVAVGASIVLDKGKSRISIFDSSSVEKVALGYLNGLAKNDGSGNYTSSDYGLWVKTGNTLVFDGAMNIKSGDMTATDASLKFISGTTEIIRLGTDSAVNGLHLYGTSSVSLSNSNGYLMIKGTTLPSVNNTYDLGSGSYLWNDVYSTNIRGLSYVYGAFGTMLQSTDEWLRLNNDGTHTSGIYCGPSIVRTDGQLQVGASGSYFLASSSGTVVTGPLSATIFSGEGTNITGTASGLSIGGNSATASKLLTQRTIALTGSVTGTGNFDGSSNLSITTTTNHTHPYLPIAGGTLTGSIVLADVQNSLTLSSTVNADAITITNNSTGISSPTAFVVNNNGTSQNANGIVINNSSVGTGMRLNNSGWNGFSLNNQSTATGSAISITNSSTNSNASGLRIESSGASPSLLITNNSTTAIGAVINNQTTGRGAHVSNKSSGYGLSIANESGSSGVALKVTNYGSGNSVEIDGVVACTGSIMSALNSWQYVASGTLPAGGTWAYAKFDNGYYGITGGGVAAGGTNTGGNRLICWRVG